MRLVFFGPPGAGKGTQAKRLAESHALTHLSTGDLFRAAIEAGSPLGRQVEGLLRDGQLVPDDVTNRLVADRLEEIGDGGFVLDGFPRTLDQAEWLLDHLSRSERHLDAVLSLRVPEDHIVGRISGRRSDPVTGRIYHMEFSPPPDDVPADRLVLRNDDRPESVLERLAVYRRQTEPLEAFFRARTRFVEIDGVGGVEAVAERIGEALAALRGTGGV